MQERCKARNEILFTSPDLPIGDHYSFDSIEIKEINESMSDIGSDEDFIDPIPKIPYVMTLKKISKESPHKRSNALYIEPKIDKTKIIEENQTVEITKITDTTRNSHKKENKKMVGSAISLNKTYFMPGRGAVFKGTSKLYKLGNQSIKEEIIIKTEESILLRKYWARKRQIDEKYEKMEIQIDKESNFEISLKIDRTQTGGEDAASKMIDELSKIKEYYENVKDLLKQQKIIEEEELLQEFQTKVGL